MNAVVILCTSRWSISTARSPPKERTTLSTFKSDLTLMTRGSFNIFQHRAVIIGHRFEPLFSQPDLEVSKSSKQQHDAHHDRPYLATSFDSRITLGIHPDSTICRRSSSTKTIMNQKAKAPTTGPQTKAAPPSIRRSDKECCLRQIAVSQQIQCS